MKTHTAKHPRWKDLRLITQRWLRRIRGFPSSQIRNLLFRTNFLSLDRSKMTKGSYTVGDEAPTPPSRKDTSYRSFICVLLIFLCICLIILFASLYLGSGRSAPSEENNGEWKNLLQTGGQDTTDIERNVTTTNKTHEGLKMGDEVTTEKEIPIQIKTTTTTEDIRRATEPSQATFTLTEQDELTTRLRTTLKVRTTEEIPRITDFIFDPIERTTERNRSIGTTHRIEFTTKSFDNDSTTLGSKLTEEIKSANTTNSSELEDITSTSNPKNRIEELPNISTTSSYEKSEENSTTTEAENSTDFITKKEPAVILPINQTSTTTTTTTSTTEELPSTLPFERTTTTASTTEPPSSAVPIKPTTTTTSTTEPPPSALPIIQTTTTTSTTDPPPSVPPSIPSTTTTSTTEISIMESESVTEPESTSSTRNVSTSPTEEITTETILLRRMSSPLVRSLNPVCATPVCKTVASRILSMMNHSSEPCVDFYEFACGNFYQTLDDSFEYGDAKMLEEALYTIGASSAKFLRDFQTFYQSCVGYEDNFNYRERMTGLEASLDEVGQFQLNDSRDVDLTDLVSSLLLRQSMPLFDIGVDVDKQSSNFILQLNLPYQSFLRTSIDNWSGLSLLKNRCLQQQKSHLHDFNIRLTDVYKLYQMCQADYSAYLHSLETVIRDMTAFSNLEPDVLFKEIKDIRFTIEFEVLNNLDTLPPSATILSNFISKNYQMRKVSDLQRHFPIFDWKRLFQALTGHQVQDGTLVQVYFAQYFQNVFQKLIRVDKRKLNNAFLAIHSHDLFINTVIPKEKSTRNRFCVDLSKKLLPDVWSHLVHQAIPASQQEYDNRQVTELFSELKSTFCRSLLESEWIDEDTKVGINGKCGNLNVVTFLPPDANSLFKNYEILNITQDYQSNLVKLLMNFKKIIYSTEGTVLSARDIFSYFLEPMSRKPLTFYSNPMIAVPLGLMKRSHRSLPDYLVKTRVGFSLARQLARHFDPTGMTYGVSLKSVSKSSYSEFVHTMTNLMDYSSPRMFHDRNISFILNGSLSINERIVDNTAFRLIYDSLLFNSDEDLLPWISAQYSREKVFFIAAAQELCKKTSMLDFMLQVFEQRHLPAVLRVENIMGNSPQFASKFSCPAGSGMDFPVKLQFPDLEIQEEEEYQEEGDNLEQNK